MYRRYIEEKVEIIVRNINEDGEYDITIKLCTEKSNIKKMTDRSSELINKLIKNDK